jgi:hypothetical protein
MSDETSGHTPGGAELSTDERHAQLAELASDAEWLIRDLKARGYGRAAVDVAGEILLCREVRALRIELGAGADNVADALLGLTDAVGEVDQTLCTARHHKGPMKIYVASSWRNCLQPGIVHALRRCGHDVYDFRAPAPGNDGFRWSEIDPDWQAWTPEQYRAALDHRIAVAGYGHDIAALRGCDACVLVLPAGRSASWEFGYAMGQGKRGYVVQFEPQEPELMFREAKIITQMDELFDAFGEPVS